jgi:hypothetical protein
VLFCTAVKYSATSSLHELTSHELPVSADDPGMLHGDAVVQIWTDFTGSALDGPKVVGTACGVCPEGEALGFEDGDPEA